ncbi:hypothetical protein DRQ33_08315, partial [bacterium]
LAVEKIKSDTGKGPEWTLERVDDQFRGFILQQEKIRFDSTLDAVLSVLREKSENKVIEILFKQQ